MYEVTRRGGNFKLSAQNHYSSLKPYIGILIYLLLLYRVSINFFPDYKHLLQENYCMWNTNILFFQNVTQEVFFTTHQYTSTCAPFVARRTSNRQSISLHVFSNMSSVIVAKASVILAFKFVISGTGVENTLSLTYRHKKNQGGGDIW